MTVPAAAKATAPYQGIQLGSMWYVSLDYINHQTSLTADQARTDPDGRMRFVVSERDPGVANWLERTGHSRGYVQLRWQRLTRDLGRTTARRSRSSRLTNYRNGCRFTTARGCRHSSGGRASPRARPRSRKGCSAENSSFFLPSPRKLQRQQRQKRGVLMLLRDKVVVVAGIGPGLGRSIALASAREGADVVLAARTASRLDDVAKEVTALGRRGLAVPTDLTDPEAAQRLAEAATGRVRAGGRAGVQRARDAADQRTRRGRPGRAEHELRRERASPRCG